VNTTESKHRTLSDAFGMTSRGSRRGWPGNWVEWVRSQKRNLRIRTPQCAGL